MSDHLDILFKGVVKWFNNAKGYGFVEHVDGQDVFIHYSVIESDGYRTLKDGEEIEYEINFGEKGLSAKKVRRLVAEHKPFAANESTTGVAGSNLVKEIQVTETEGEASSEITKQTIATVVQEQLQ